MIEKATRLVVLYWPLITLMIVAALVLFSRSWRNALRTALRVASRPLLLLAVVAIVYDGTETLARTGGLAVTPFETHWKAIAPRNYEAIQRMTPGPLWSQGVSRIARLPAWLLLGGLGLGLAYLGRRRDETNIFAN